MKNLLSKIITAVSLMVLISVSSCNKNNLEKKEESKRYLSSLNLPNLDSIRNQPLKTTIPFNQPGKLYPSDADGNIFSHKQLLALRSQNSTLALCEGMFLDEYSFRQWFKEVSYDFISCPGSGNPDVFINFKYEVEVPGNLSSSGNLATIQISAVPAELLPAMVKTAVPSFNFISTRYDADLGSDVNKYSVKFGFTMPYNTFCKYEKYRSKVKLSTDCEAIPSFTIPYQNDFLNFTPDAYQSGLIWATSNTNTLSFNFLVLLCGYHCHFPALGYSDSYILEYRLVGTTSWNTVSPSPTYLYYYPNDAVSITVPPGTYEYRYKAKVKILPLTSEILYSDYHYYPANTVVVP